MKQHISSLLHSLSCVVCNPFTARRRRQYADDAHAAADMAYFRTLVEQDRAQQMARSALRRERLETALDDMDAEPWQRTLLTGIMERYERGEKNLIISVPPQHPQFGTRVHESIEASLAVCEGDKTTFINELMLSDGSSMLLDPEVDGYPDGHMAQDEALIDEWDNEPLDEAMRNFFGTRR